MTKEYIPLYEQPKEKMMRYWLKTQATWKKNHENIRKMSKERRVKISLGQLLEIVSIIKKIMAALQKEKEGSGVGPLHSCHMKTQDFILRCQ